MAKSTDERTGISGLEEEFREVKSEAVQTAERHQRELTSWIVKAEELYATIREQGEEIKELKGIIHDMKKQTRRL